eukprot:1332533-Alexandrium_andersonii.AAC.1
MRRAEQPYSRWTIGCSARLMLTNEDAPELQPVANARQLGLRRGELVADGALDCAAQHAAEPA